jgi:uncharacterized membrane protein YoaT (DUF817 family)
MKRFLSSSTASRFHSFRLRLEHHQSRTPLRAFLWEFGLFVFKQGWACLFGALLLALMMVTRHWSAAAPIARYDFLFLAAIAIQIVLLLSRMESFEEAKVILAFHVVGTAMEVFKTGVGSWTYPGQALFHLGHVPLFSGFMYSSVGSYLARTTRIMNMRYTRYPPFWLTVVLAALIYANFFTHHFLPDARVVLFALVVLLYGRTLVYYRPFRTWRRMPLLVGFCLVALFIWVAENVATFATIWTYPHQRAGWHMVRAGKYGAWLLLMIISFILVTCVHRPEAPDELSTEPTA